LRPAGRVGRAHGLDGSFYVNRADAALAEGSTVTVGGKSAVIERRAGTDQRPLIRLSGIDPREHTGELLLVDEPLEEGEYDARQLVGAEVVGVGRVDRVVNGPSCDVLEVGEVLIPFVSDAIRSVDVEGGVIEVDRAFLGLE
jgi:16S rRNA processing protein RimM